MRIVFDDEQHGVVGPQIFAIVGNLLDHAAPRRYGVTAAEWTVARTPTFVDAAPRSMGPTYVCGK